MVYRLTSNYPRLALIETKDDMAKLMGDEPGVGSVEMAEYVCQQTPYSGWYIPHNYPSGDDIMLCNTDALEYVKTLP